MEQVDTSMDELLADLLSIGIAPPAFEVPYFTDEPKYPCYFYPKPAEGRYTQGEPYGMCLAADPMEARAKALAEFYERLCLYHPRVTESFETWTPGSGWIDPASFLVSTDPVDIDRVRRGSYSWLEATEIRSGRNTKIPAQTVVPGFGQREERILAAVGTSGASLGRSGDTGRLQRGLFEVLERHTTGTVAMEDRIRQRVIDLPDELGRIECDLRGYRLEPFVFHLSVRYSLPWVMVVVTDHSGCGPALSFATRCAPTFGQAIGAALVEVLERRRPARMEDAQREPGSSAPRVYPWETLEMLAEIEPQLRSAAVTPFHALPTTPRTMEQVLDCFAADGVEVLAVDTTLPEVAAAGFEASKVVVPALGPLPV